MAGGLLRPERPDGRRAFNSGDSGAHVLPGEVVVVLVGRVDFTEVEAVDSQACVRRVVQPPLLPPAAGGVRVHLASCDPCGDQQRQSSAMCSKRGVTGGGGGAKICHISFAPSQQTI